MNIAREDFESLVGRVLNSDPNEKNDDWKKQIIDSFSLVKAVVIIEEEYNIEIDLEQFAIHGDMMVEDFINIVMEFLQSQ